jgi:hypothetical protein
MLGSNTTTFGPSAGGGAALAGAAAREREHDHEVVQDDAT